MANRAGVPNHKRFPYRFDKSTGMPLCRICGKLLNDKRRTFCGPRCVRDFMMKTDWSRVRRVIYERDGGICMKCGQPVSKDDFHVDHIVPICAGGDEWDLSNLELSCPKCNLQKEKKVEVIDDELQGNGHVDSGKNNGVEPIRKISCSSSGC